MEGKISPTTKFQTQPLGSSRGPVKNKREKQGATGPTISGGSIAKGKTSNDELDAIIKAHISLPALPCDCTVRGPQSIALTAKKHLQHKDTVLVPIFARHHWIAGICTHDEKRAGQYILTLYDSAPAPVVHADVAAMFRRFWPELRLRHGHCARQRRGSEDCGLYMLATFLATDHNLRVGEPETIAARLRTLLKCPTTPTAKILEAIRAQRILKGGSSHGIWWHHAPATQRELVTSIAAAHDASERTAASHNLCYMLNAMALHGILTGRKVALDLRSIQRKAASLGFKRGAQEDVGEAAAKLKMPLNTVGGMPEQPELLATPTVYMSTSRLFVTAATPDHRLPAVLQCPGGSTAVFIAGAKYSGNGQHGHFQLSQDPSGCTCAVYELRQDELQEIENPGRPVRRTRNKRGRRTHAENCSPPIRRSPTEDQTTQAPQPNKGTKTDPIDIEAQEHALLQLAGTGDEITVEWRQKRNTGKRPQPWQEVKGTITRAWLPLDQGVRVRWAGNKEGLFTGMSSTREYRDLVIIPKATAHTPKGPPPLAQKGAEANKGRPKLSQQDEDGTRATSRREQAKSIAVKPTQSPRGTAIETPTTALRESHLNEAGRRPAGSVCPRTWYIYREKPPHVSLLGWNATSEESRKQHIRWLLELQGMPEDLCATRLAAAALELVRRMAQARRWRWSTISRALSSITSALKHLPMYTNAQHPIDLDTDPEWVDAKRAAAQNEKESPASPPPPITLEGLLACRKQLRSQDGQADLFLAMMWAFAARAGDIGGLNKQDVQIDHTAQGTTEVALSIRRGKGAKRSGPYPAPSTMAEADARKLLARLNDIGPRQRVFQALPRLKAKARAALKHWDPKASLPSLRSGAARHLAAMGMPEDDLARLLGHKSTDTLRRYLGYAENLTVEARRSQRHTRKLHQPLWPPHGRTEEAVTVSEGGQNLL